MAIPAFVQASSGWVVQTGTGQGTLNNVTPGNLIFIHFATDGSTYDTSFNAYTGVNNLNRTSTGYSSVLTEDAGSFSFVHAVWVGRATSSTVTTTLAVGAAGNDVFARLYEFTGGGPLKTAATVLENSTSVALFHQSNSATIQDRSVTTNGPDRLALNFVAVNANQTMGPFTGMTGGTWAEATSEYIETGGTVMTLQLQTASMASAGVIDGGTYGITSAGWGVIGTAIKPSSDVPYSDVAIGQS